MKKIFLLLASALFICSSLFCQEEVKNYTYCEIVGTSNLMQTKVKINVDYGQAVNIWKANANRLKDEEGKVIKFNSMIDALNYMGSQGWEFVQAYAVSNGNGLVYHYLLKMEIPIEELNEAVIGVE